MAKISYSGYHFPPEIIQQSVRLARSERYFFLSCRNWRIWRASTAAGANGDRWGQTAIARLPKVQDPPRAYPVVGQVVRRRILD